MSQRGSGEGVVVLGQRRSASTNLKNTHLVLTSNARCLWQHKFTSDANESNTNMDFNMDLNPSTWDKLRSCCGECDDSRT